MFIFKRIITPSILYSQLCSSKSTVTVHLPLKWNNKNVGKMASYQAFTAIKFKQRVRTCHMHVYTTTCFSGFLWNTLTVGITTSPLTQNGTSPSLRSSMIQSLAL